MRQSNQSMRSWVKALPLFHFCNSMKPFRLYRKSQLNAQCTSCLIQRTSSTQTSDITQWRAIFKNHSKNNISPTYWYQLDPKALNDDAAAIINKKFKGSVFDAVSTIFPERDWHPWKFKERVPNGFWHDITNQRKFFDELGKQIGIKTLDDWYSKLNKKIITNNGGSKILDHHSSLFAALTACYPEHNWLPWKFHVITRGYWNSLEHQRLFFSWLAKELGINHLDEWSSVSAETVVKHGGLFVNSIYGSCLFEALKTCYPEHNWIRWSFNAPLKFWVDLQNQRSFFDWLGNKVGINKLDDWYQILSTKLVKDNKGYFVHHLYRGSVSEALMAVYPEHCWLPWKFKYTNRRFWKSLQNRKKFFDWLGREYGVKQLDDWYIVFSLDIVQEHAGWALGDLQSPLSALMEVYPENKWDVFKFEKCSVPQQYWNSPEKVSQLLSQLSEKLAIHTLDDWYRVAWVQLRQFGVLHVVSKLGGLYDMLRQQYPDHPWDKQKFKGGVKKTQRWLVVNLQKLYPNEEILEDYVHPKAKYEVSQLPIRLDAFLPSKSLAFEYQGQQHYQDIEGMFEPARFYRQRDEEKRKLCADHNIRLIEVPYWWKGTLENLKEIINSKQPSPNLIA